MLWMRFIPVYFLISGLALAVSVFAIFSWGLKYSIDFTGGSSVEYRFSAEKSTEEVENIIKKAKLDFPKEIKSNQRAVYQFKFGPEFNQEKLEKYSNDLEIFSKEKVELLRFETVGPTLSSEILKKTLVAIVIGSMGILSWVAWQFRSIRFGVCAIFAMAHDSIILLGAFAILGYYLGVEVDILFVTAMLTILSFSVHDTIVVYDRVRESQKKSANISFVDLANKAVSETMVRSLNNSLTIIFMLFALFLMGGETIKWFVLALLVGTVSGTYSSPFVAVPLLVVWDKITKKSLKSDTHG